MSEAETDVKQKTMCIQIQTRQLGTSMKVDPEAIGGGKDVDREMLHVSKDILERKALRSITGLLKRARAHVRDERAIPAPILRGGIYLLPDLLVDEVATYLSNVQTEVQILARRWAENDYAQAIEDARERLGRAFDARDYPPAAVVATAFELRWNFFTFDVPERIKSISKAIYDREKAKAQDEYGALRDEAKAVLRAQMEGLVRQLVNLLRPDPDTGRPRVVRVTSTSRLSDFLAVFPFRDVFGDDELARQVAAARDLLSGVDPAKLGKDFGLREALEKGFSEVAGQLTKLVEDAPLRRFARRADAA